MIKFKKEYFFRACLIGAILGAALYIINKMF